MEGSTENYSELFLFEDWLNYRVFYTVVFDVQMCNNSQNFSKLLHNGMSIHTLNKIQKEQEKIYNELVKQEYEFLTLLFKVKYVRDSVEPLEFLKLKIERVEEYIKINYKDIYFDIISTRKVRGIKIGATLITVSDYYSLNKTLSRKYFIPNNVSELKRHNDIDEICFVNPYINIEAHYLFLKWLVRLSNNEFTLSLSKDNLVVEINNLTNDINKIDLTQSNKRNTLFEELKIKGFFGLTPILILKENAQQSLIDLLIHNETPYQIAMLEHLGFINHLSDNYFNTKKKLYDFLGRLLNNVSERTIKGNINTLNPRSNEKKERYTAHLDKEKVEKDYNSLKLGVLPE